MHCSGFRFAELHLEIQKERGMVMMRKEVRKRNGKGLCALALAGIMAFSLERLRIIRPDRSGRNAVRAE